ncbi:MAG: M67 family metallopeptidase [Candidatus Firestonebacteria bacterium]|nr:M67 family metallopeptidase [Candidatus Firestonebacteria bacterium]
MEIRKDIYDQMVKEAIQSFPKECCGILAGKNKLATKIYSVKNVDPSPETSYLMESNTQLKILKTIDKIYIDMVAVYHSHPNSECFPSERDIELISYPECLNVIISLADIDSPEVRAFLIKEKKIIEEQIKII